MVHVSAWKVKLQLSVKLTYVWRSFPINIRLIESFFSSVAITNHSFDTLSFFCYQKLLEWKTGSLLRKAHININFYSSKAHPKPVSADLSHFFCFTVMSMKSQTETGIEAAVDAWHQSQTSVNPRNQPQGRKAGIFPPAWLFK